MDPGFRMHAERTPNPNSIKWVLGRPVSDGSASAHFETAPAAEVSPLAARLFAIDGVLGVAKEVAEELYRRDPDLSAHGHEGIRKYLEGREACAEEPAG